MGARWLCAEQGAKVVCAARTVAEGDHRMLAGSLQSTVAAVEGAREVESVGERR